MGLIRAEGSSEISAPPAAVYAIIADYVGGHPRILPSKYFGELVVEKGGTGAGTVIRFAMKGFGNSRLMRGVVTEPEPGRVLVESYPDTGGVTTFTVEPSSGGTRSAVRITTEWEGKGIAGFFERLFAPSFLARVYRDELALLDAVASERSHA
jgi:hypothetical protein